MCFVDLLLAGSRWGSSSILPAAIQHKHMTIQIAVYTKWILLMMSSKPARNM